ncbi:MAG: hypothetical protein ACQESR_17265 [Planctomycetota bacterium]
MESCSTQAVLPLVGLAADKVIRDRYAAGNKTRVPLAKRLGWQEIRVVLLWV